MQYAVTIWLAQQKWTFFLYRDYMEYHSDRFHDFSLIIYNDKGNIMALISASIDGDTVISHICIISQ